MPTITISYRRSDSSAISGRIYDRLCAHYGEHSVFMDIDNIPFGIDFRSHIQETLQRTDVLIAVVGAQWLGMNADGTSRMQQKTDPVRVEIETALARKTPIIPVLVDGAKMPDSSQLPPEFGDFAFLNAAEVTTGRDFRGHMERLIAAIDRVTAANVPSPQPNTMPPQTLPRAKTAANTPATWLNDTLRYFALPLVVLLVVHHMIVNAYDLNDFYLQFACVAVPLAFGSALFWLSGRGTAAAAGFAIAFGVIADIGMTVSQSLYSGDPILPQTRVEWWDNFNYVSIVTLSYLAGYLLSRALLGLLNHRKLNKA
jgi:TIR domain